MKLAVLALGLWVLGTSPLPARADGGAAQASAVASVHATVAPMAGVSPASKVTIETTAGGSGGMDSQSPEYTAVITFHVIVNQADVAFRIAASSLYIRADPSNGEIPPLPLDLSAGVQIQPTSALPSQGHSNLAAFVVGPGPVVAGFPTTQTETVPFTASGPTFNQDVTIRISWMTTPAFRPVGQYAGIVQLTALILPPGP